MDNDFTRSTDAAQDQMYGTPSEEQTYYSVI